MDGELVNDEEWNRCFGCSPHNRSGLQLRFKQNHDGTVECRFEAAEHLAGPPGVMHGGIQAVLLDEVMGMTARVNSDGDSTLAVTAELKLRYRRPVPLGQSLRVRGRLERAEGDDLFLSGEILGPDGEVLTLAESRFKAREGRGHRA